MEFKITSKTHDKFFDRMLVNFRVKLGPKETIKIDDAKKLLSDQSPTFREVLLFLPIKAFLVKSTKSSIA